MAGNTTKRFYPQHEVGKPVDPATLNNHVRFILDNLYDVQSAIQSMTGGAVIIATLTAGTVSGLTIAYPGFGYADGNYQITFTPAGATGTAVAKGGKIVSATLLSGGSYSSQPSATVALS